eukprot:gb/GECH01008454.1/.p1 GENE.gb/GECH01008454.1/~~gb/GECH01008454.1/.p1  ORF type:complete len:474 (+),score=141.75 gb/GECH01008454.1/:1-1422(+)
MMSSPKNYKRKRKDENGEDNDMEPNTKRQRTTHSEMNSNIDSTVLAANLLPFVGFNDLLHWRLVCRSFNTFVEHQTPLGVAFHVLCEYREATWNEKTLSEEFAQKYTQLYSKEDKETPAKQLSKFWKEQLNHLDDMNSNHNIGNNENNADQHKNKLTLNDRKYGMRLYSDMTRGAEVDKNGGHKLSPSPGSKNKIRFLIQRGLHLVYDTEEIDDGLDSGQDTDWFPSRMAGAVGIDEGIIKPGDAIMAHVSPSGLIQGRGLKLNERETQIRQDPDTLFRLAFFLRCIWDRITAAGVTRRPSILSGANSSSPMGTLILQIDSVHEKDPEFDLQNQAQEVIDWRNNFEEVQRLFDEDEKNQKLSKESETFRKFVRFIDDESEIPMKEVPHEISSEWYLGAHNHWEMDEDENEEGSSQHDVLALHQHLFVPFHRFFDSYRILQGSYLGGGEMTVIYVVGTIDNYMGGFFFMKERNS